MYGVNGNQAPGAGLGVRTFIMNDRQNKKWCRYEGVFIGLLTCQKKMTMSGGEEKSDATKIVYQLKRRTELDCTWQKALATCSEAKEGNSTKTVTMID